MKINLISLGCAKNLVDSEYLLGALLEKNYTFVENPQDSDVVILNTCSFISSARKEAKLWINRLIKLKEKYNFKLLVIGCLPQIEKEVILKKYPQVDAIFGVADFIKIPNLIKEILKNSSTKISEISSTPTFIPKSNLKRVISGFRSYAYLKIADGCDNRCSYCLIPSIRGNYREREIEDILKEAEIIVQSGVKEIILVSNDTTFYGLSLYKKKMLNKLIRELSKIKNLLWIRILYAHPGHFYEELIDEIANNEKVCKYLDIPIQHTSDKILSLMRRPTTKKQIFELVEKLRYKIKDITLRTTVMVGFPSETDEDFRTLLDDIKQLEFDWLGAFEFSCQKNTLSYEIKEKIPKDVRKERFNQIMKLQQEITHKKNKSRIGKIYKVICDTESFGHTEFQCPEVDGKTYIIKQPNKIIETVRIKDVVNIYDLSAEII